MKKEKMTRLSPKMQQRLNDMLQRSHKSNVDMKVKRLDHDMEALCTVVSSVENIVRELKQAPNVEEARQAYEKYEEETDLLEFRLDCLEQSIDKFIATKHPNNENQQPS